MLKVLWGKKINQSSIQNAQVTSAVGEEGRLTFRNAVAVLAVFFCLHSNNSFAATDDTLPFNIPQQRADLALTLFAEQANLTLVFPFDQVKDKTANRLVGHYPVDTAVTILLQDTGLTPTFSNQLVLNIAIESKGKRMNITNSSKRKTLLATLVGLFAASGGQAVAQGEAATEQSKIDEIIVTATRRETSLNDTAISVAAIGGEEISRRNLSEMNDYLRTVPGVNFIEVGVGNSAVVTRGLTTSPQFEGSGTSIATGVYLGDVPLGGLTVLGQSPDLKMIDLARVEVLRGPQGTLFGSGALAGAVRNIPNGPNLNNIEGSIKTSYSSTAENGDDNTKFEGVINIPLIEDVLALRAVAYRHDKSGYINNVAGTVLATNGEVRPGILALDSIARDAGAELYQNQDDVGNTEYAGGRIAFLWKPIDDLNITLTHLYQDVEQFGQPYVELTPGLESYEQITLQFGDGEGVAGLESGFSDEINLTNLVLEYDLGWANLLSSSAWSNVDGSRNRDESSFGGRPIPILVDSAADTFSQEFRLVSQSEGSLQYVIGIFYQESERFSFVERWGSTDEVAANFGNPFGVGTRLLTRQSVDRSTDQLSIYGEVSYDFTEQVELTLGARRFDYERSEHNLGEGLFGDVDIINTFDESGTSLKANLSYRPNDDILVYGQWAEGFRLGNANFPLPPHCDVNNDGILDGTSFPIRNGYDSDTTENIELGAKLAMFDNRLQVNAAVYQVDWQGIPLIVFGTSCGNGMTINGGEARSQGFEIETIYQVTEDFQISLGGAFTDAELTEDAGSLGLRGDRLPSAPDYSANLGLQYDFEAGGYASYVRGDYAYVSDFYNKVGETGIAAGDYGQFNASAGITLDGFNIELFARNLTNEDALTHADAALRDNRAYQLRPRTIGLNVGYQF